MFDRLIRERDRQKIRRMSLLFLGIITVLLVIPYLRMLYEISQIEFEDSRNELRYELNPHQQEILRGNYTTCSYSYAVLSKDCRILYNNTTLPYKTGDYVSIQEFMEEDEWFHKENPAMRKEAFVLENQKEYQGAVIYCIPKSRYKVSRLHKTIVECTVPMAAGGIAVIVLLGILVHSLHKKILKPITEISQSAKEIIKGNYDMEVVRTYETKVGENELGDLIFSFELMRDELKERQIREENLKHSQQELISCISHDLRTPISTIKAYTEGLRDGIADTREKEELFHKIILDKVNLLSEMIEELLEYSNTQLNQLSIQKEEMFFLNFWNRITEEICVYVNQQDGKVQVISPEVDALVRIDARRMMEVMNNLIENSIKYRSSSPLSIQLIAKIEEKHIIIRVIDNGIGIGPDDMNRIFDKFYRAEKSRSSSIPGSGLGLSICKYIIEQHGGNIYCRSHEGCEIGFTIPLM